MSGSLQRLSVGAVLVLGLAGCGGSGGEHSAGDAARTGVATMRAASIGHLQAVEAKGFLESHPEALVLDVRNPDEWDDALGHIEGARLIPLPELEGRLAEIAAWKDRPVVTVCRSGVRSARAARILSDAGFRQALNLEGGMSAWRRAGN